MLRWKEFRKDLINLAISTIIIIIAGIIYLQHSNATIFDYEFFFGAVTLAFMTMYLICALSRSVRK